MSEPIHILSLGAGVQSSAMALMAAVGEITPMPTAAIFADTQDEPKAVYEWLGWLSSKLSPHFPVVVVSKGRLSELSTRVRTSKKTGMQYLKPSLPVFTLNSDLERGMMFRHCSMDEKIAPLKSKAKEIAGRGNKVVMWIGMSTDEVQRVKDSPDKRIVHRWPLIEKEMTRNDCLAWMRRNGYPKPPRSACIFCPYHSDKEWVRLRDESPEEFQFAVDYEKRLQHAQAQCKRLTSVPYLHASRIPLDQVDFNGSKSSDFQMQLPCEGMCGV